MKNTANLSSPEPADTTRGRRRCPPTCRVGSLFILSEETKGGFKQLPVGWGKHFTLVGGGLSHLCVVEHDHLAGEKTNTSEVIAHEKTQRSSNGGMLGETTGSRGSKQHEPSTYSYAVSTGLDQKKPQHDDNEGQPSPRNDSACGVRDSITFNKHTNKINLKSPGSCPQNQCAADLNVFYMPKRRVVTKSESHPQGTKSTESLLYMNKSGVQSTTQVGFYCPVQDKSNVSCSQSSALRSSYPCHVPHINQVWVGSSHTLVCDDAGSLYSLQGSQFLTFSGKTRRKGVVCPVLALRNQKVATACAGDNYSLAVTITGEVYSWGSAFSGQLGRMMEEVALAPRFIGSLMRIFITSISCNESHVVACSQNGQCFGWGSNDCGQLGLGIKCSPQPRPQPIQFRTPVGAQARVVDSLSRTLEGCSMPRLQGASSRKSRHVPPSPIEVVQQSTTVCDAGLCIEEGEAHAGSSIRAEATGGHRACEPIPFIVAVAAGWRHSLALTADGDAYAWGLNACGQLGVGHFQACYAPVLIQEYENSARVLPNLSCCRKGNRYTANLLRCVCAPGDISDVACHECSHGYVGIELSKNYTDGRRSWNCCRSDNSSVENHKHGGWIRGLRRSDGGRWDNLISTNGNHCSGSFASQQVNRKRELPLTPREQSMRPLEGSDLRDAMYRETASEAYTVYEPLRPWGKKNASKFCVDTDLGLQLSISQICAGQLFSAFLSGDGRVFLAGYVPTAKQPVAGDELHDCVRREYASNSRVAAGYSIPAPVPGLQNAVATEIACSNEALIAFVPCQVLGVQPNLVPLPSPEGPFIELRLSITIYPEALRSTLPGASEAGIVCETANPQREYDTSRQDVIDAPSKDGPVRYDSSWNFPNILDSAVFINERCEKDPAPQGGAEQGVQREWSMYNDSAGEGKTSLEYPVSREKALTSVYAKKDVDCLSGGGPVQQHGAYDVLVRFRSLRAGMTGVSRIASSNAVVRGRLRDRLVDDLVPVAEVDCTCHRSLLWSMDTALASETDRLDAAKGTTKAPFGRQDLPDSSSLGQLSSSASKSLQPQNDCVHSRDSEDMFLPDLHHFHPKNPKDEAITRAYYRAKHFLEGQEDQVLPYALECVTAQVSVDGGCCWSNAEYNKAAASIFFARFPEALQAVCPNNITVEEENILVKFTCIHKSETTASFIRRLPSPTTSFPGSPQTSTAVDSRQDSSHNKRAGEKGDGNSFEEATNRCYNGGSPSSQPELGSQAEVCEGSDKEAEANKLVTTERPFPHPAQYMQNRKNALHSADLDSVRPSSPCVSGMFSCSGEGERHGLSYSVLAPARLFTKNTTTQNSQLKNTKWALQCSSPAFDKNVITDYNLFVDVSLNGVHFTGKPYPLRVIEVETFELSPDVGYSGRDTKVYIRGIEHCDSSETAVLLKYEDDSERILPGFFESETQQLYFIMPKREPFTPVLPVGNAPDTLRLTADSADNSDFSDKPLTDELTKTDGSSDPAFDLSAKRLTPRCERESVNCNNNTAEQARRISVHLSYNGQIFSSVSRTFLQYDNEPAVVSVLAYTVTEGGDLYEVDLESVVLPGTRVAISLRSAVATTSAQARLTILKRGFTCPVLSSVVSAGTGNDNTLASHEEQSISLPSEAVECVMLLPAKLDMTPHRVVLQSDHNRTKRRNPAQRGTPADSAGKAKTPTGVASGNTATGNMAGTYTAKRAAGMSTNAGGVGAAGDAVPAISRLKGKGAAGFPGGPPTAAFNGTGNLVAAAASKSAGKRQEKTSDSTNYADGEDENTSGPTLTVTIPRITINLQQTEVPPTDAVVLALGEISLDGQHFVSWKYCSVLRLQCIREVHADGVSTSRFTSNEALAA